jgi:hydrogenase maturation protease
MQRLLVLGVGNVLLTDEGAGVHAARLIAQRHSDRHGVEVIDGGTLGFILAPLLEGCTHLIVFDAAQLQSAPGTVRMYCGDEMERFLGLGKRSAHEVSLIDLLDIARLTNGVPERRALIAIQPDRLDWGEVLTAPVAQGVERAAAIAIELMERWSVSVPAVCSSSLAVSAQSIRRVP